MKITFKNSIIVLMICCFGLLMIVPVNAQFGGGMGTEGNPYIVNSPEHLNNIRNFLGSHFRQNGNIDMSEYLGPEGAGFNGGLGWNPIGVYIEGEEPLFSPFTGSYNGYGYAIVNLTINRPDEAVLGLFGYTLGANLKNIHLTDSNISGYSRVGALVGLNNYTAIENCSASGIIEATNHNIGGLVGRNDNSLITGSSANVTVNVTALAAPIVYNVGGLVGRNMNGSTIHNSYAEGDVTAINVFRVGGLVGDNAMDSGTAGSSIVSSHSTGAVSGDNWVGGLTGRNYSYLDAETVSTVANSYASGLVSSVRYSTGGLVGRNDNGIIEFCYATGDVVVSYFNENPYNTGGLVGRNVNNSIIRNSYATGNVAGYFRVGGLVGHNFDEGGDGALVINCYSTGKVSASGDTPGGLIGFNENATVTNSYWDTDSSGRATSSGGDGVTGRTTDRMTHSANFPDWAINTDWQIDTGQSYPYLSWQGDHPDDFNIPKRQFVFDNGVYTGSVDITGNDEPDITTVFTTEEALAETGITFRYSTNPYYSSVQLFAMSQNLGTYYGYWFEDDTVLTAGLSFKLQLTNSPNNIWYRYAGGTWLVVPTARVTHLPLEPDFTYLIDVEGLFDPLRGQTASVEFASDSGGENTLPVELSSFTAISTDNRFVQLQWVTESETNMLGYHLFRSIEKTMNDAIRITLPIIPAVNTCHANQYTHTDENVEPGMVYYYWLQVIDLDLTACFHGPISIETKEETDTEPELFVTALQQNYPNPFNPETTIQFSLQEPSNNLQITIYNIQGQTVKVLYSGAKEAGNFEIIWRGDDAQGRAVSSGIYFYRMTTENFNKTYKMIMLQ